MILYFNLNPLFQFPNFCLSTNFQTNYQQKLITNSAPKVKQKFLRKKIYVSYVKFSYFRSTNYKLVH